ncbi:hypothetical protein ABW20_dc0106862 [Dactylellina cionopaga]|nr:hypothetical protein ABW20_dc0106862 [Dactylellina cionopaga]
MNWKKLSKVKKIWVSVEGSVTSTEDLEELYDGLVGAGSQLESLSVEQYISATHKYLLNCTGLLTELELWGFWENVELGCAFWDEVIPRHAPSLKTLRVHNRSMGNAGRYSEENEGAWSWSSNPSNKAKLALSKCKLLESIAISFCIEKENYLTEMVESLVASSVNLHTVNLVFRKTMPKEEIRQTLEKLEKWTSTDKLFDGRALTLIYEDTTRGQFCFPKKIAKGMVPLVWFDILLQSWKLERFTKPDSSDPQHPEYKFARLNDLYLSDDRLVQY